MAAPTVSAVSPNAGLLGGGNTVTVTGTGFFNGGITGAVTAVTFGVTAATRYNVVSDTVLTAVVPAHAAGMIDVTVTTPGGTSATSTADEYTFEPTITTQVPGYPGAVITYQAAGTGVIGDSFYNDGMTVLRVKNTSGGDVTVTVKGVNRCSQNFLHDNVVVVHTGTEETIGPFDPGRFSDGLGMCEVTYSSTTSVTVAAVRGG